MSVSYRHALRILNERFVDAGLEISPAALLQWVLDGELPVLDGDGPQAGLMDVNSFHQQLAIDAHLHGEPLPSIRRVLAGMYFSEAALRDFQPSEWWLTHDQVQARWVAAGLGEAEVDDVLRAAFSSEWLVVHQPLPAHLDELVAEEPSLALVKGAVYPRSEIERKEAEYAIDVYGGMRVKPLTGAAPMDTAESKGRLAHGAAKPSEKQRKLELLERAWSRLVSEARKAGVDLNPDDIPGTKAEFFALVRWLEPDLRQIRTMSTFDSEYLRGRYRFPRRMKGGEHGWNSIFPEFF
jgi:hypothetical protein